MEDYENTLSSIDDDEKEINDIKEDLIKEEAEITLKLDYSIESPEERNELVKRIVENTPSEKLTPKYLEILSNYLIFAMDKQERKQKRILTDNRMYTINKNETSFEGLVSKFESGEDAIYNMIANDKNIICTPKVKITEEDIAEVPGLKELRDEIEKLEPKVAAAKGKKKYLLMKQLIEMRKDQYVLRSSYRQPIYCMNLVKSFNKMDFSEKISIYYDEDGYARIKDDSLISFFNPEHISMLLCHYSRLKEEAWGDFKGDSYYLMEDLDAIVEGALKDKYPLYRSIVLYKIDGRQNAEIQELLREEYGTTHSLEYISALWRRKIPKIIARYAEDEYLIWYFTMKEKGYWKKCSKCGQIKLGHPNFFSINNTAKDHWYSQCKCCRNKK